jgi:hypothetical protein
MKRALSLLIASIALAGVTGCATCDHPGGFWTTMFGTKERACQTAACPANGCPAPAAVCPHCQGHGCEACCRQPLPPSAAMVAYPYYTVHGPRDFFAKNTPSIGP